MPRHPYRIVIDGAAYAHIPAVAERVYGLLAALGADNVTVRDLLACDEFWPDDLANLAAAVERAVLAGHDQQRPDRHECPDFEHRGPHHGAHGAPDDEWADEHGWQPRIHHDPADRRIYRLDQPIRGVVLAGVGGRVDWAERDGVLHITVTPR